ncbi:hydrophobin [Moniliophthora roreri]|nr:hydrophobin [Moniliophthora roreri]
MLLTSSFHVPSSVMWCSVLRLCITKHYPYATLLESSESVFQLVEPPEAPFLMFFPSCGRLVGTVTWAGNKEVTVLIGSVVPIPPKPEGTEDTYTPP